MVWNNTTRNNKYIEELYNGLFDESFEEVCDNLFQSINELLFAGLPQYLSQQINDSIIYVEKSINTKAILNKTDEILSVIKLFNNQYESINHAKDEIANFIKYGTKYILQKSVLKDYDYYPDFVIIKRDTELTIIHYSIKKMISCNNKASYKIQFKNDALPFILSGIIRDNFLHGTIETKEELANGETITSLEECLFNHWGFRSDIKINDNNKKYHVSKINAEVNKLVS